MSEKLQVGQEVLIRAMIIDPSVRTAHRTAEVKFLHGGTQPVYVDMRDIQPIQSETKREAPNSFLVFLEECFAGRVESNSPAMQMIEDDRERVLAGLEATLRGLVEKVPHAWLDKWQARHYAHSLVADQPWTHDETCVRCELESALNGVAGKDGKQT